ncbi:alanine dehydrogenase [Haoranjiania flava]|uniref:alanine dehydrogenase n=1 Tax=Haoranjiania flava TaxID=1856322 RepID=A0AAE3ILT2_9BACT|nr:alanine dehydrogenase [Haoranjiania flava]MCU7693979.1 alanine dehydrogenase [Haoranjiania flava]
MATAKPIVAAEFSYETLEETLDVKPGKARLVIGIPKEEAMQENRISLIPEAVQVLVNNGHQVTVQSKAGEGSKFTDKDYSDAGAKIVSSRAEVFKSAIIIKSAPITECDLPHLQKNQTIISPLHYSLLNKKILEVLLNKKISALGFELIKDDSDSFPIVRSMSEIAGSASMLIAGQHLDSLNNGKGVLLGGISGIPPTKVIIIGAGIVGEYAARAALALGASVKVFDNDIYRLKRLQNHIGHRVWTSVIEPNILSKQIKTCEVAVGALNNTKGRVPVVVTEEMVAQMRPGSVIVDVCIDRGGCFETSEITTHENPTFTKYGVIHYCVPNIASGFARTASQAISNVLSPLLMNIADEGGFEHLLWHDFNLRDAIYLYKGYSTNFHISERFGLKYTDLHLILASKS